MIERLFWLVRLRWVAIVGVATITLFSRRFFNLGIPSHTIYLLIGLLAIYNLALQFQIYKLNKKNQEMISQSIQVIINFQISFDLLILMLLIHFTGGTENPFIFYFIFHIIISGVTLSRIASFLQTTFAILLFLGMASLEYTGIINHYPVAGYLPFSLYNNPLYLLSTSLVFITTLYIAFYMASSVAYKLRKSEETLGELNKQLQEKDRIKSEYVLRVSHDIKDHLSSIITCVEPVEDETISPLEPKQKDLLRRAVTRARKLLVFVRALLEITKLKLAQELKPEEFSFNEMIDSITKEIETKAEDKSITFITDISQTIKTIKGVKLYIEEALSNILMNSIKYTPTGGKISIKVEDRGPNILIKIQDSGIGISKEDLPFVFDEFYRAKNAKTLETMGTGLGLSISKKIVRMHKGKIWVDSQIGKGTTFYIELPK